MVGVVSSSLIAPTKQNPLCWWYRRATRKGRLFSCVKKPGVGPGFAFPYAAINPRRRPQQNRQKIRPTRRRSRCHCRNRPCHWVCPCCLFRCSSNLCSSRCRRYRYRFVRLAWRGRCPESVDRPRFGRAWGPWKGSSVRWRQRRLSLMLCKKCLPGHTPQIIYSSGHSMLSIPYLILGCLLGALVHWGGQAVALLRDGNDKSRGRCDRAHSF
jgi:hypothetical protein